MFERQAQRHCIDTWQPCIDQRQRIPPDRRSLQDLNAALNTDNGHAVCLWTAPKGIQLFWFKNRRNQHPGCKSADCVNRRLKRIQNATVHLVNHRLQRATPPSSKGHYCFFEKHSI